MKQNIRCIGCGACYRECRLQMDAISCTQGGVTIDLKRCNRCGHCVAVCPTGQMDHPLSPLQEEVGVPITPEQALRFLRTPRSVRRYRQDLIPKEVLYQLLDAGRHPSTAKNTQGVQYHVVRGREKVCMVHDLYFDEVRTLPKDDPDFELLERPVRIQKEKGFDALFYDCPQLIFAVCNQNMPFDPRNALFSLTYISLMAPSIGLGTCWSGQMQRLSDRKNVMPRLAALIGLREEMRICGCMMVGYPDVSFRRFVQRDPLQISWWETDG